MVRGAQSSNGIYVSVAQTWVTTERAGISYTVVAPQDCQCGQTGCDAETWEDYE